MSLYVTLDTVCTTVPADVENRGSWSLQVYKNTTILCFLACFLHLMYLVSSFFQVTLKSLWRHDLLPEWLGSFAL